MFVYPKIYLISTKINQLIQFGYYLKLCISKLYKWMGNNNNALSIPLPLINMLIDLDDNLEIFIDNKRSKLIN